MKKLIGFIVAHVLYWLGDMVSRPMHWADWLGILYRPYNWLMVKSGDVQEWAGNKTPWGPMQDHADN